MSSFTKNLLQKYSLASNQVDRSELAVILEQLETTLQQKVEGDVVELGCYVGTTSLFLQRMLREFAPQKTLHVYDSFAGLPPKTADDESPAGEQFKQGELSVSKSEFIKQFKQAGLSLPVIHKNWFSQLNSKDTPSTICFAFLDGDFYESIRDSLRLVWPRLASGAVVIIDDYQSEALPGARAATDAWLKAHHAAMRVQSSLAIVRPS